MKSIGILLFDETPVSDILGDFHASLIYHNYDNKYNYGRA